MSRSLLVCAILVAIPGSGRPAETMIRLRVQPMAAPKPALRYQLLPELKEMQPGNPIPVYVKCFMDQDFSPEHETLSRSRLREADRAARLDKPDWQLLLRLRTDGFGLLLPDLQKLRELANDLKGRAHEEILQGRLDDALYTTRTLFALSRHVGEHPTLIGDLVAVAIAAITIGSVEEMLEQPGCPNLYWALTNLPNPLISVDKGMQGERVLLRSEFREMDDRAPMSREQIRKMIVHIDSLRRQQKDFDKQKEGARAWIDARVGSEEKMRDARRRLIEYGIPEDRLARFPADQVVLLDEWREFEVRRDEGMKLMNLPTWQVEQQFRQFKHPTEPTLFDTIFSALEKVRRAQGRLEQRIALLRCVEALRLHAALHDGKLPEKLSDCPVPLPDDPFTGKPFRYQLEGATAHLRGTPPRGEEANPGYNIRYEITIQK